MSIDTIIQEEFSEESQSAMAEANKRLGRLYKGAHLDEWLGYVDKLTAIRTAALHAVHTNSTRDRAYGIALKQILHRFLPKFLDGEFIRPEATALMWLGEEAGRLALLAEYREGLTPAQHVALATPKAARNAVQRMIAAREAEQKSRELGNKPDSNDVGEMLAGQLEDEREEPSATDAQLRAAFRRKFVNQMALLFIKENQARAVDLADAIKAEIKAAKLDAREAARKAAESVKARVAARP